MTVEPYRRKANFYETDRMGIIHHANYVLWFEEARVDLLEKLNFPYEKVMEHNIDFGVLDVYCEYKSMVQFGETVNIYVSLEELKEMRMSLDYKIINARSGEICTLGKTKHFFYSSSKRRPVSLKKEIPELYELFCTIYSDQK